MSPNFTRRQGLVYGRVSHARESKADMIGYKNWDGGWIIFVLAPAATLFSDPDLGPSDRVHSCVRQDDMHMRLLRCARTRNLDAMMKAK